MTSSWPYLATAPNPTYSTAHAAQAYTTVNARTSLSVPSGIPPPPPPSAPVADPARSSANKSPFSPAIREYVARAFLAENLIPGIDMAQMTSKLKDIIETAKDMPLVDWSSYPLPQHLIQMERSIAPAHGVASLSLSAPFLETNTRKRKSPDTEVPVGASIPPWRQRDTKTAPQQTRTEKKQKKAQEFRSTAGTSKFNDLEKRARRFGDSLANSSVNSPTAESTVNDGPVVGTCQDLEKKYFRLTAAPKPEAVRPLHILKQSLDLLIRKWKEQHNYTYICDQFKSLRQDLTVQHINNEFTVRVYEAHARIALERSDLGEYNQCQSQLRPLYKQNLGGRAGEFTAYRILYLIHTRNRTGMNDMLADLTVADKKHPAVTHALEVRSALATGNYHKFFKLYDDPPNMGGYLMDMFVQRERIAAMASICKAYKPDVKVQFLTAELSFANDQECAQFLCDHAGEEYLEHRDDGVRFVTSKAIDAFQKARQAAFGMVDIKGQI
ncbi:hypothetical protein ANO11243_062640 [Dothideomycetidae sp. 11243]|nr:hypothetical protein ANO11243_062640 [fungal sp. No.11243]